jgi:two-component system, cell cycle response regulator
VNLYSSCPPVSLDTLPPPGLGASGGRVLLVQTSFYRERVLLLGLAGPELDVLVADPSQDLALLVEQSAVDAVLLDRDLPNYDAVCRSLKTGPSRAARVVVVDWADALETSAVEALEAGADEFVVAPGRACELKARVENQLKNKRGFDIARRLRAERDTLRYDSRLDALTSVLNRKALDTALYQLESDTGELSVVFIDVDYFKSINDTFGHSAGDRALAALGRLLGDHVRPNDVVGRYGGEEFLIVLRDASGEVARRVAERIRQSIAECAVPGLSRTITLSAGIACRAPGESLASVVARADYALYSAKRAGRDRVIAAAPASGAADASESFVTSVRPLAQHAAICAAE